MWIALFFAGAFLSLYLIKKHQQYSFESTTNHAIMTLSMPHELKFLIIAYLGSTFYEERLNPKIKEFTKNEGGCWHIVSDFIMIQFCIDYVRVFNIKLHTEYIHELPGTLACFDCQHKRVIFVVDRHLLYEFRNNKCVLLKKFDSCVQSVLVLDFQWIIVDFTNGINFLVNITSKKEYLI
jgi:hypothetical protein